MRAGTSQKATVLVAEDEHPLRLAVTKKLGKTGFGVLEADNASDTIGLLRAKTKGEAIDVMLLDLTIPSAPSHEVLAEAAQAGPNMKVILTSAYNEDIANAVLNAPRSAVSFASPFSLVTLCERVGVSCPQT
jgi:DNA-binding NtrC family response regulator